MEASFQELVSIPVLTIHAPLVRQLQKGAVFFYHLAEGQQTMNVHRA